MVGMPRERPGDKLGTSRDTRDVWADLWKFTLKGQNVRGGQTGQMTGQMGHVHGTDGTHTHQGVSRQNSLFLLVFAISPLQALWVGLVGTELLGEF